jgi:dephospho-CoA kinase
LYKIGLTGGIGSGKSKLREYLAATYPRVFSLDLDLLGHAVYRYNPLILRNMSVIFGD